MHPYYQDIKKYPITIKISVPPHHDNINSMLVKMKSLFGKLLFDDFGALVQRKCSGVRDSVLLIHASSSFAKLEHIVQVSHFLANQNSLI